MTSDEQSTSPTILVGYTPNDYGRAALDAAIVEARRRSGRLMVINTSRGDRLADPTIASSGELTRLDQTLTDAAIPHQIIQHIGLGEPADDIIELAHQHHADLIVIGIRHRTAVGKLLLGSTAQRVLLQADCPVLAVKR